MDSFILSGKSRFISVYVNILTQMYTWWSLMCTQLLYLRNGTLQNWTERCNTEIRVHGRTMFSYRIRIRCHKVPRAPADGGIFDVISSHLYISQWFVICAIFNFFFFRLLLSLSRSCSTFCFSRLTECDKCTLLVCDALLKQMVPAGIILQISMQNTQDWMCYDLFWFHRFDRKFGACVCAPWHYNYCVWCHFGTHDTTKFRAMNDDASFLINWMNYYQMCTKEKSHIKRIGRQRRRKWRIPFRWFWQMNFHHVIHQHFMRGSTNFFSSSIKLSRRGKIAKKWPNSKCAWATIFW